MMLIHAVILLIHAVIHLLIHAVIHLLSEQWLLKVSYLKTYSLLLLVHTLTSLRRTAYFLVMTETLLF